MDAFVADHRGTVLVDGAGHWVQQERPAEVNAALLDFLAGLDLGRPGCGDALRRAARRASMHRPRRRRRARARRRSGPRRRQGVRHLRVRPPLRQPRRDMLALGASMEGVPDLGAHAARPRPRRVHGPRVLRRGRRARARHRRARRPARSSRRCRSCSRPTGIRTSPTRTLFPCGYSERMLLSAPLLLEVPNGLDPRHAALTEPMAVGLHAVNKAGSPPGDGAARARLRSGRPGRHRRPAAARASSPIVASRLLARPAGRWPPRWAPTRSSTPPPSRRSRPGRGPAARGRSSCSRPSACRGSSTRCCGSPRRGSRIVVVGVCMQPDAIPPFFGISKELSMQFVLGLRPEEFAGSLRAIAEGEIDVDPDDHRRGRPRRRPRRLRPPRRPRGALQDPRRAGRLTPRRATTGDCEHRKMLGRRRGSISSGEPEQEHRQRQLDAGEDQLEPRAVGRIGRVTRTRPMPPSRRDDGQNSDGPAGIGCWRQARATPTRSPTK